VRRWPIGKKTLFNKTYSKVPGETDFKQKFEGGGKNWMLQQTRSQGDQRMGGKGGGETANLHQRKRNSGNKGWRVREE